jgi:altronate dehydratase large subunit
MLVVYLVECAHHVARRIAEPYQEHGAQLIGFPGCYPSAYAHRVLEAICTHPNTHSVLLVSLGCEEFRRTALLEAIRESGRPAELLVIQHEGGTAATMPPVAHGSSRGSRKLLRPRPNRSSCPI